MDRSTSTTSTTMEARGLEVNEVELHQSRGALVRNAMDGLQRFKQSWKSVMLLKAGVGLGQVIVLTVLLILATILASPIFPSQTQNHSSDACPHPELYQAWMGVQIARLTICWSVSCWMCIRTERSRRRRQEEVESEERLSGVDTQQVRGSSDRTSGHRETSELRRNPNSFSSRFAPSLSHSLSSTSALMNSNSSVPSTPQTLGPSSSRLDLHRVLELDELADNDEISLSDETKSQNGVLISHSHSTCHRLSASQSPSRLDDRQVRERQSMRSLRQAREMRNGNGNTGGTADAGDEARGFAGWLDKHALNISRGLGVISMILFLLGNLLLFYPPPSNYSCYSANPMLWWGVLTVTAVGWVLLLQVFFVVVIVGLGGAVVLNALQRLGVMPAPVEPEPPRAAQPEPLTQSELDRIKVVCYLPENSDIPITRLPLPPVYLSGHQSTCAICQENFEEPKEGRTILLKADKLRQLGCGHVYHMDCIDQWLLRGSGNCPSCNAPVRSSLPQPTSTPSTPSPNTPRRGRIRGRGDQGVVGSPV